MVRWRADASRRRHADQSKRNIWWRRLEPSRVRGKGGISGKESSVGVLVLILRERGKRRQEAGAFGSGEIRGGSSKEMQVLRLAPEFLVAPKCGRNEFGGFAQGDRVFFFVGIYAEASGETRGAVRLVRCADSLRPGSSLLSG
jgi:hypothetical protein